MIELKKKPMILEEDLREASRLTYQDKLIRDYGTFMAISSKESDITPQMFCLGHLSRVYVERRVTYDDYTEIATFLTRFYTQLTVANFMKEFREMFYHLVS
ncbi:hypothetical protein D3C71_617940 [compost metagenome]